MSAYEMLKTFWRDENGAEAVEWALIIGLVAAAAALAYGTLGDKLTDFFNTTMGKISSKVT